MLCTFPELNLLNRKGYVEEQLLRGDGCHHILNLATTGVFGNESIVSVRCG